ncbi:MAG: STAS domain-containing protein [Candidatus Sericytochromatia bacterium]
MSDRPPALIEPTHELNAQTSPALREGLLSLVENGDVRLIVDLTAVTFIDSSGLGALVAGLKAARREGGHLVLVGLQEQARLIFQITQADGLFPILPDQPAARAFFAGTPEA